MSANLLIKDQEESSPENNILRELGVNPGGKGTQNQIDILQSYELAETVVDSLNLQISIYTQGRISSSLMYGQAAPILSIQSGLIPLSFAPTDGFYTLAKTVLTWCRAPAARRTRITTRLNWPDAGYGWSAITMLRQMKTVIS